MRLIDADKLQKMKFSNGLNNDGILYVPFGEVIRNIKNAPTAYDVEKVVAKLEEERKEVHRGMNKFGTTTDLVCMDGTLISAIEIVRKGGIDG